MDSTRFVDFEKYCETCAYKDEKETAEPCCECLDTPTREGTEKPTMWKEKA